MPPLPILLLPAALQASAMLVDEGVFHRRRGLKRWERLGHPVDSLGIAACYAWLLLRSPADPHALKIYIVLAAVSCLLVTKDEFVHARECEPLEHWLHAVLFILHPIVLAAFGLMWWTGVGTSWITAQLVLTLVFAVYQLVYWSVPWKTAR
jgi:hypothetical protein